MDEQQTNGIVIGIVKTLDDPDRLGRMRVELPHQNDQLSYWAPMVTPMAGAGRGVCFLPEVGEQVLVAFEHGDPRRPYVLGSLWSKVDRRPADDGKPTENN